MNRSLVIKVGGSLYLCAQEIIKTILAAYPDALILPGGGAFANNIRKTGVNGTPAHWMAIAAMEQYGWYLSTFGIKTTESAIFSNKPLIFLPYRFLLEHDPLPHSWDITSDTISAWLAAFLHADLLILKSIDQIRAGDNVIDQITRPMETDDLDPAFIPFVLNHHLSGMIINGTVPDRITQVLQGRSVTGTRFGTTI